MIVASSGFRGWNARLGWNLRPSFSDTAPALKWTNTTDTSGGGFILASDSHLFFTQGNVLKKVDPDTGAVVLSRDFGSALGPVVGAQTVGGVDRIYVLQDIGTATPDLHCVRASDLTTIWTRSFAQAIQQWVNVHNTASGILILVTDAAGGVTRATRDDGAGFISLWTSTQIVHPISTSSPGGTRIYSGDGTNFRAVNASDGVQAWAVAGWPTGGTALSVTHTDDFLYVQTGANVDTRKLNAATGATVWTAANPFGAAMTANEAVVSVDNEPLWYSGATLKAFNPASGAVLWTYTHFETIQAMWIDAAKRLYISGATKIQCRDFDNRSLLWEIAVTTTMQPSSGKANRLILMGTGKAEGYDVSPHAYSVVLHGIVSNAAFNAPGAAPNQRVFFDANSGKYIITYLRWDGANIVTYAFRYSTGPTFYEWSAEQVIQAVTLSGTQQFSIEGFMDGSGNVYVAFGSRSATTGQQRFVKLTRSGDTWAAGSVVSVGAASAFQFCAVAKDGTGRVWIVNNVLGVGDYRAWFSDNDGTSWADAGVTLASVGPSTTQTNMGFPAIALFDGQMGVVLYDGDSNNVRWARHVDSAAAGTWAVLNEIIADLPTLTNDGFFVSCQVCVPNHSFAKLVTVVRCDNAGVNEIRLKRYVSGAWATGFKLLVSGANRNQPAVAAGLGAKVVASWRDNNTTPITQKFKAWDLDTDSFDAERVLQTATGNGMWTKMVNGTVHSIYGQGAASPWHLFLSQHAVEQVLLLSASSMLAVEARAGIFRLPQVPVEMLRRMFSGYAVPVEALAQFPIARGFGLEVEALRAGPRLTVSIPAEWDGTTPLVISPEIPVEALRTLQKSPVIQVESMLHLDLKPGLEVESLQGLRIGPGIPVEFTGSILVFIEPPIPVEALARVLAGTPIPVESRGIAILVLNAALPIETLATLLRQALLEIEASGLALGIAHVWKVLVKVREPLLHEWIVVPVTPLPKLQHQWDVTVIFGTPLTHSWRVLPQAVVTAYSEDIQLPIGKVEK